jgi:hypothetical protein
MVGVMVSESRPTWWRVVAGDPPRSMLDAFDEVTGDDHADAWGLSAALVVARTRRETGEGPSFSELFQELMPRVSKLTVEWPTGTNAWARSATLRAFRLYAAVEWKRRGWISWDVGVARSLRTGRTFSNRGKQLRKADRPLAARGNSSAARGARLGAKHRG